MKVIFFGIYSKRPEYPRSNNLLEVLKTRGVEVIECHYSMADTFQDRFKSAGTLPGAINYLIHIFGSFFSLSLQYLKTPSPIDAIIVVHPGHFHFHLVRFLNAIKKSRALIINDFFFSLYDTLVHDRRLLNEKGFAAGLFHFLEGNMCRSADLNLVDTIHHGNFSAKEFKIPKDKFLRIFVGSSFPAYNAPSLKNKIEGKFSVLFVGTFIPLHGIDIIVQAAGILRDDPEIHFRLVGTGQLKEHIQNLVKKRGLPNIIFQDWVPTSKLGKLIRSCDLSLGIFGQGEKASRVIPIKVFDICASGTCFITADTPAIREVFRHKENAYLIPAGDPTALANAIQELKVNQTLREKIAQGAWITGKKRFSRDQLGKDLIKAIADVYSRQSQGPI
jgi:glycosyltransferase involved in cell wall biosynthesis